ncbi:hypothetical protein D9M68_958090 [compost metagenome]
MPDTVLITIIHMDVQAGRTIKGVEPQGADVGQIDDHPLGSVKPDHIARFGLFQSLVQ